MNLLKGLFGKKAPPVAQAPTTPTRDVPPQPLSPHFVIGDLHGSLDLLEHMLERIDDAIGTLGLSDPKLVFVGDYIDRGPSSAGVLRRLHELSTEFPNNVTCLLGNHEQMMLDFIDAPAAHHARWFRNGAEATVASFAVSAPSEDLAASADAVGRGLRQALGGLDSWLRSLPTQTSSGNPCGWHGRVSANRPSPPSITKPFTGRDGRWITPSRRRYPF